MATQEPVEIPTVLEQVDEFPEGQEGQESGHLDEVTDDMDPIISMLTKERLALGWTQWDVARRMGQTSGARVSQLESGQYDLQLSTLRSWANALGIEVLARKAKSHRGRPQVDFR